VLPVGFVEGEKRQFANRGTIMLSGNMQVSSAPGVVPSPDPPSLEQLWRPSHTGVKLQEWHSSPFGRRVVRSEIARY